MTKTLNLGGPWKLYYAPDDGKAYSCGEEALAARFACIPAEVPGDVELDMMRAGLEPDPFYGDNILKYEKYEYYNFLLERTFRAEAAVDGGHAVLLFHGINTYADIYLNGNLIGHAGNMMIDHEFDVTDTLLPGADNKIAVFIRSAMNEARKLEYAAAWRGAEQADELTRLRMPPHSFGWDIMPRLLSAGLWRTVELVYRSPERLVDFYMYTESVGAQEAELGVAYVFESNLLQLPVYTVKIEGVCGESRFESTQNTHFISNRLKFKVKNPCLWWPHGYGEAALYDVRVTLLRGDVECDRRELRFGIRTATVDASFELSSKQRFCVMVNGEKIFIHGTNWVPLSALHSLDESRVDKGIALALGCGCNALRCWGGNVYESDRFYKLCDENGLLVWQDFTMACSGQPSDDDFAAVISNEAKFIVKRLRNHACLLLWAGDNEVDSVVYERYPKGFARYNRITREVLPRMVAAHDPMRYFLPSSPYVPAEYDTYLQGPEQHLWGPRDDFKGDFYRLNKALFASEIGYHGCPCVESLKQFIGEEQLWPFEGSRHWLVHNTDKVLYQRRYDRNELMKKQAAMLFGAAPAELSDFVFASQVSQAEAKKFFIEQFRMKKWDKTGLLWWNVVDGWPQISDAVVDYYYRPKLAYHVIARSQQSVQLMLAEYDRWQHEIIAVNDTLRAVEGTYRIFDADSGETAAEGQFTVERNGRASLGGITVNPSVQRMYILEWTVNGKTCFSHYAAGRAPFALADFKRWMGIIAALPPKFDTSCQG